MKQSWILHTEVCDVGFHLERNLPLAHVTILHRSLDNSRMLTSAVNVLIPTYDFGAFDMSRRLFLAGLCIFIGRLSAGVNLRDQ